MKLAAVCAPRWRLRLAVLLFSAALTGNATGQEFIQEHRLTLTDSPHTLLSSVSGSGWVVVSWSAEVTWSRDEGQTWKSAPVVSGHDPQALEVVGDSMLVVVPTAAGLQAVLPGEDTLQIIGLPPDIRLGSFSDAGDGWLVGGLHGVSRSADQGQTWSTPDTLFISSCCTGRQLIRTLRGGVVVAFARIGQAELNEPRMHYSEDSGRSWSVSSSISIAYGLRLVDILSTPEHVEIQVHEAALLARRTWGDPFVRTDLSFQVYATTVSDVWGVVVASSEGLFGLRETDMTWQPLGPPANMKLVSAGPDGKLWVVDFDRNLFLWTPVGTGTTDLPRQAELTPYPNPARSHLYVTGAWLGIDYDVIDLTGRVRFTVHGADLEGGFSVQALESGSYFLKARDIYGGQVPFLVVR
jgi:hypothetical protein